MFFKEGINLIKVINLIIINNLKRCRIQHLQAEEILVKEEILRVIKEFKRHQLIVSEMKREGEKTGSELDQGEIKLFQQFDSMHSQQDQLEDLLETMLMQKKLRQTMSCSPKP